MILPDEMRNKEPRTKIQEQDKRSTEEMPTEDDLKLIDIARAYRERAYVPYSHFPVGSAVRTRAGHIYGGCNVENASYPLTNCAERTAIFKAISEGDDAITTLAVIGDTKEPCAPCGACRQVLAEFAIDRIVLANLAGDIRILTLDELLPFAFGKKDLA